MKISNFKIVPRGVEFDVYCDGKRIEGVRGVSHRKNPNEVEVLELFIYPDSVEFVCVNMPEIEQ